MNKELKKIMNEVQNSGMFSGLDRLLIKGDMEYFIEHFKHNDEMIIDIHETEHFTFLSHDDFIFSFIVEILETNEIIFTYDKENQQLIIRREDNEGK